MQIIAFWQFLLTKINVFEMISCIHVITIAVQQRMGYIPSLLLDLPLVYVKTRKPSCPDKPARRLRKVCTVYVSAVGL